MRHSKYNYTFFLKKRNTFVISKKYNIYDITLHLIVKQQSITFLVQIIANFSWRESLQIFTRFLITYYK